jgi:tRNA acetyltransferase TAN1
MATRDPIDPVKLVREICVDTTRGNKRTRWAQRFTPITATAYANLADLRSLAEKVLKPVFSGEGAPVKYAIRPNLRDNTSLPRDTVIQTVASVIGREHIVDLKNYDVMILVETVKNITGMSVVTDFDKLKRFNVEQLYQQHTTKPGPPE